MHRDTFNADFYFMAATVIPLLYLAITLQGQTFQGMITRFRKALVEYPPGFWKLLREYFLTGALGVAVYLILVYGIVGEWDAITALYNRSSQGNGPFVLSALLILLVAVGAGPALAFLQTAFGSGTSREMREKARKRRQDIAGRSQAGQLPNEESGASSE